MEGVCEGGGQRKGVCVSGWAEGVCVIVSVCVKGGEGVSFQILFFRSVVSK